MNAPLTVFRRSAALAVLALLFASPAAAELGARMDTVANDAAHMKAQRRVTANSRFAVHEMTADSGTVVREYVSPAGTVFAVSWNGPYKPDLRQIMGQHFDTYTATAQRRRVRGPHRIEEGNLVVEITGHPRDFHGRAYLSDAVPANVEAREIQ